MQHYQLKTHLKSTNISHVKKKKQWKIPQIQCSMCLGKRSGLFILNREAKAREEPEMSKIYLSTVYISVYMYFYIPIEER